MLPLVFPLSFGSDVFVQTNTPRGRLQGFVHDNPVTHLVGTVPGLLVGGPVEFHLLVTPAWMAGLLVVFVPLALRAYVRRA
ncbi:hypothetical protein ACTPOK_38220 [Streptomyces inhibens]|uniref:hypothetical protein n=1 Tax=Streptomyces inhibens TaxID=2293571 RepID=UPI00402A9D57